MQPLPRNLPNAYLLAMLGGALSSILGLSVVFGWYTHNVPLIQISAAFVPMQFNTALGFLLSGLGLLLIIRGHRRAGISCGIFVILLGLLTLVEYMLGINLGIDQLLMQHDITVETSSPGRMAPNTALCFSLAGAALAALGTRAKAGTPTLITCVLGSLIVGLGFTALSGYLSTFEAAYGWGQLTRMAVHTASGFMLLGVAFVSIAWHLDTAASGRLPTWFPLPVGIGVATIIVSLWQAVVYDNARLREQYGGSGDVPLVDNMILVTGIVLACVLTLTMYLVQLGRMREREADRTNRELADEITERKQAEQKLHKSQRLYATLSQVNHAIVREQDKQKLFKVICDAAVELGKFRLSWIGLLDEEKKLIKPVAFSGEGSDCLQDIEVSLSNDMTTNESVTRLIREGKSVVFNDLRNNPDSLPWCAQILNKNCLASAAFPLRLHDSTIGTFNVCAVEFHHFDEDETGLLEEMALDISFALAKFEDKKHREQAEKALQGKGREQREILDTLLDAVITIGETGNIISFNKTAEVLFGYSFEEVMGQNVKRLVPEPDSAKHDSYLRNYLETGDAHILGVGREVEGQHKDKQTFPMRLSVAELPVDETGRRRFVGTCQDLTQSKQQEEQLRRTQKMDALGKLTGGVAHDFNNMLSVVTGYADMLQESLADQPELAGYAHEIQRAGERGAKLTKKLLSFSRQAPRAAAKLDINKMLQQQQDMLQKTLTVRIRLLLDLADDVWPIWLDHSELEDAIVNMSINAMHAMKDKESGAWLTIRTCNQSLNMLDAPTLGLKAGDYVRLSLADTGAGMDDTIKEKIFDPFFSTKGEQGTGLGLSQVFGFVKRAGGAIQVYSEPGHGSRFALYFPRYREHDIDAATPGNEDVIDLSGKENILVVDDEAALRRLASRLLSQQGYQVFCAENGKQALQILEHEHIDLMLSDIIMPGMDGYQLASVVQEKYPAIKIQLASGFAETWNLGLIDESLHQNLLDKPYDSRVLLIKIRALLDN